MQITKNTVVTLEYTLKDKDGTLIDQSSGDEAFVFIHGVGGIIPGLETALEGKSAGDALSVEIEPEEAYGQRDDALVAEVPLDRFEGAGEIQAGMQFQTADEDGTPRIVTVVKVEGDTVTVDSNHPLAGIDLCFDVKVLDLREATAEELEHGHVHGPGGHEH